MAGWLGESGALAARTQDDGVHLVTAMGGERFGLVVWGWDSFVSYGYPAGSNVERINVP